MKKFYIYCHTNKINGKKYIGQTCQKLEKRWNDGRGYINCPRFYSAIIHYGWDNFTHEILEIVSKSEEADEREKYYIKLFQTQDDKKGYNMTEGGNSLITYYKDKQHRKEQSLRRKQYFKDNPEKKKELVDRLQKISKNRANEQSAFMKEKYQQGQHSLYEINQKRKRRIRCVETNEIFDSLTEASKKYNISVGNISSVINGKRKTAGNYHWESMN